MSFINLEEIGFKDGAAIDSFGRLRASQVTSLFDYQSQYNTGPRDWSQSVSGTGAVTHLSDESSVQLSTGGTASGASAIRQTRLCWRYQSGKGQQIFMTFMFGTPVTGVRRRLGYFDDDNGIYLEQTTTDLRFVVRSSISGSPVDTTFASQSNWNMDKLDGTGTSGKTLDISKAQLMFIDFQWLGVGRVRCGFFIDGIPIIAHEFNFGNVLASVYMTTANLPLRYEIVNTSTADNTATLKAICASVMTEGGDESFQRGNLNCAGRGTSGVSVSARSPVLSIRPAATFNGIPNRAWYIPINLSILNSGNNDALWEIVFGGSLTGASWSAAAADSCVEFDTASTSITGGTTVIRGFVLAGQGSSSSDSTAEVAGRFPNSVDSLLGTQAGHSLVITPLSGSTTIYANTNWREIY